MGIFVEVNPRNTSKKKKSEIGLLLSGFGRVFGYVFQKIPEPIRRVRVMSPLIGQSPDIPQFTWKLVSPRKTRFS